jgi:hypothetical protein
MPKFSKMEKLSSKVIRSLSVWATVFSQELSEARQNKQKLYRQRSTVPLRTASTESV